MARKRRSNGTNLLDLSLQKSLFDTLTGAYDDAFAEFFKDEEFRRKIWLFAAEAFERLAYVARKKLEEKNDNNNGKRGKKSKRVS